MEVLDRIDELRKQRGWSVNNLVMEAMLTQSTLNNLYVRRAEPKLSTLRAICAAFGISLAEFFRYEELPDNDTGELLRRVEMLSPLQKHALLEFLRASSKTT